MIAETSSITMPRLVSSNYGACLSLHRHRRSCCPPSVLKAICYHSKHHHNGYCAMFNPADEPDTMLLFGIHRRLRRLDHSIGTPGFTAASSKAWSTKNPCELLQAIGSSNMSVFETIKSR